MNLSLKSRSKYIMDQQVSISSLQSDTKWSLRSAAKTHSHQVIRHSLLFRFSRQVSIVAFPDKTKELLYLKRPVVHFIGSENTQHFKHNSIQVQCTRKKLGYIPIKTAICSCFYHLKNISKIRQFLSRSDFEKVIHVVISSRLYYCSSVCSGLSQKSLS